MRIANGITFKQIKICILPAEKQKFCRNLKYDRQKLLRIQYTGAQKIFCIVFRLDSVCMAIRLQINVTTWALTNDI